MKKTQTKETTLKVLNQQGEIVGYLTEQDEEKRARYSVRYGRLHDCSD